MSLITTRLHGMIDYVFGFILIGWAGLGEFTSGQRSAILLIAATVFAYSLATRYELGLLKMIAFRTHLVIDVVVGVLLFALPYLAGISDGQQFVAYVMALVSLMVVALSDKPTDAAVSDAPTDARL